jgi:hypothetical protein
MLEGPACFLDAGHNVVGISQIVLDSGAKVAECLTMRYESVPVYIYVRCIRFGGSISSFRNVHKFGF